MPQKESLAAKRTKAGGQAPARTLGFDKAFDAALAKVKTGGRISAQDGMAFSAALMDTACARRAELMALRKCAGHASVVFEALCAHGDLRSAKKWSSRLALSREEWEYGLKKALRRDDGEFAKAFGGKLGFSGVCRMLCYCASKGSAEFAAGLMGMLDNGERKDLWSYLEGQEPAQKEFLMGVLSQSEKSKLSRGASSAQAAKKRSL